ncbi:facilitated trehalose transporter Tret1-like [Sitodiplosis mosellana]|uniref:facilitated trehalose transporter Tret1-like n=1 Tax=Sitodiplosis mosellana TaxID=263140 RepID=UPI0024451ED2|nr:facilitated trehalose transporter Tret1-like [Sitodiplosis mosellana]
MIVSSITMVLKETQPIYQWTNVFNQYYGTILGSALIFNQGFMTGFMSTALVEFSSEMSPLASGPLTNEQVSWVGSISCIGSLIGTFSFGYIANVLGCKRFMLFTVISFIVSWLLIALGNDYLYILLARLIGGWAGGSLPPALVLYISEISNNDIRGRLGSFPLVLFNIGVLISYILCAEVDYKYVPYICFWIPIVFAAIFTMLPNTPQYYLHNGKFLNAENSVKYYKNYKGLCSEEDVALYNECERLKSIANTRRTEVKLCAADFFTKSAIKGIGIGIALCTIGQFTAKFPIISYAVMVFQKTGTSLDPYASSIMMAIALIIGSLTTTYFADRLGRKVLIIVSLLGSAFALLATSMYHYLYLNGYELSSFAWVPLVSLSFDVFISSAGITPLMMVCSVENLPPKIRTFGMSIISFMMNIIAFVSMKLFPILLETLNLYPCFMIYGVGCIVGTIFFYLVLEDTSGKSLDDVGINEDAKMTHTLSGRNYNTFSTYVERKNSV